MMDLRLAAAVALWVGSTAPSLAQTPACVPTLDASPALEQTIDYDPFAAGDFQIEIPVRVTLPSDAASCQIALGVTSQSLAGVRRLEGPSGQALQYELIGPANQTIDNPATPSVPVVGPPGQATDVLLRARIPGGVLSSPGDYADQLEVVLFNAGAPVGPPRAQRVLARVRPLAQANLAGASSVSSATFDVLDFGVPEPGESLFSILQIRANTSVRIDVASEQGGVMRLIGSQSGASLPYTLRLDGDTLAPSATLSRNPGGAGENYRIDVTLGEFGPLLAGEYRDTVTIAVTPDG